jgi:hypothetical protein
MTPFQWIAVPLLGLAALRDVVMMFTRPGSRRMYLVRALVWGAAALSIAEPVIPQRIADVFAIQRGADLVFYLFVLAFLVGSFVVYAQFQRMQRQITELARTIAIERARAPQANVPPDSSFRAR